MRVKKITRFPLMMPFWRGWFWIRPRWKLGAFLYWINYRIEFEDVPRYLQ